MTKCVLYMGQQTYTKTLKKLNSKFLSNFKVLEASTKSNIIINIQRSSIQTLVFVILLISNKLNDLNFFFPIYLLFRSNWNCFYYTSILYIFFFCHSIDRTYYIDIHMRRESQFFQTLSRTPCFEKVRIVDIFQSYHTQKNLRVERIYKNCDRLFSLSPD